jgi:N-glycosylase/DNA lyase
MIIRSKNFNLEHIAESGQCFRMDRIGEGKYSLIALDKYIELTQVSPHQVEIDCSLKEYENTWHDYFDLDRDYGLIVDRLMQGKDELLKKAATLGWGIRIIRQDPFEALISFIISQNKNIPGIKRCIKKMSERFGEKKKSKEYNGIAYHAFPSPTALAAALLEDLRETGLGYRDVYVKEAALAVLSGNIDMQKLAGRTHEQAVEELRRLKGVGDKVACCISLYGLHHLDAVPRDTWIKRTENDLYGGKLDWDKYRGYAGIVQQYIFYYIRQNAYKHFRI